MRIIKLIYSLQFGGVKYLKYWLQDKLYNTNTREQLFYKQLEIMDGKMSEDRILKAIYGLRTGKILHLNNPQLMNEKIQWLKIYDKDSKKTILADKISAKEYISEIIGDCYVIPNIGVYEKFSDIIFDDLPDKFVLKLNHGSGWNFIVKNKYDIDWKYLELQVEKFMKLDFSYVVGLEKHYSGIKRKILIEEYIEGLDLNPCEYQFWVFNGDIKFVSVINEPHKANLKSTYDMDWNRLPFVTSEPHLVNEIKKPFELELMKELVLTVSEGFSFVRVDLYLIDSKIYFGEMTFTPASGYIDWSPAKYNLIVGDMLDLKKTCEAEN